MASVRQDHLVVGIDIGMTYTGVAYSWNGGLINVVQEWKGLHPRERKLKVPTLLSYEEDRFGSRGNLNQWGFSCDRQQPHVEWFKRFLDPEYLREHHEATSMLQHGFPGQEWSPNTIKRFYVDFLREIYKWIVNIISSRHANFANARVEFLFSLPATMNSPHIANQFTEYFLEAGFARGGPLHSAKLGLTEPEAAAVYAVINSDQKFEPGDTLLVVDAGGGTTDICVLEMVGSADEPTFEQLVPVEGINVGSTNIDEAFRRLVRTKIQRFRIPIDDCSWAMSAGAEFDYEKCAFGQDENETMFVVDVPTISNQFTYPHADIVEGRMKFTYGEFQTLFNPQVDALELAIRAQMDAFSRVRPQGQLKYMVLCGGLGSSAYVRHELTRRLTGHTNPTRHPQGQQLKITVTPDPQVAVMKGLVADRSRRNKSGQHAPVLASRRSRLSYGMLGKVRFNPKVHNPADLVVDDFDGKEYANGVIKWIVKKGALIIPEQSISLRTWKKRYPPNASDRIIEDIIVISGLDEQFLPKRLGDRGVEQKCTIVSDFSMVQDSALKPAHRKSRWPFIGRGDLYYILESHVRCLIGPSADLQIHSIFNGRRYEEDNNIRLNFSEVRCSSPFLDLRLLEDIDDDSKI